MYPDYPFAIVIYIVLENKGRETSRKDSLPDADRLLSFSDQTLKTTFRLLYSSPGLGCWGKEVPSGREGSSCSPH